MGKVFLMTNICLKMKMAEETQHSFRTNTIGTENVALICQEYDIRLLYISTAGVFFGDKQEPYNEFDAPMKTEHRPVATCEHCQARVRLYFGEAEEPK